MVSTQGQQLLSEAYKFTEKLAVEARTDVSAKILKVDEACQSILKSGGLVSMKSVRAWLSTNAGLTIAPQTLMNKRPDRLSGKKVHSPLRQVIDKYAEVQSLISTNPKNKNEVATFGSIGISEAELAAIPDHQVRYKAQLLVGRARNLETQLNQLRTINALPALSASTFSESPPILTQANTTIAPETAAYKLDDAEIEALADFLKPSALKRRGLNFDDIGRLSVTHPASPERRTVPISTPDLKAALEKLLKSYEV